MDSSGDAEKRIADLQHQLDQEQRIAELQRQLAEARSERMRGSGRPDYSGILNALSRLASNSSGRPPSGNGTRVSAPGDTRLSAAPRAVPMRFVLAEVLPFRWWYLTLMFVVAVPAVIVWVMTPAAALPAAVCTLILIYGWQLRGSLTRIRLLRWGQVATVIGVDIASRASYYGGVTWYNAPLPFAEGWRVSRSLWSGPSTKTVVRYALDGYQGDLTVRGREYVDGVILADQRHPARARCVTFFPYDLDRDDAGDWTGRLRPRLIVGMIVWFIIVVAWLTSAAAISTGYATRALHRAQTISVDADDTARVSGNSLTRDVSCHGGHLMVDGNDNIVTVTGHCTSLTVAGIDNTVTIESADSISVSGIGEHITYRSGTPTIANNGINNTVTHG